MVIAAGLLLGCRLVKDDRFVETRTPSLDECTLPRSPCPGSPLARPPESRSRDHREPATVPTTLPPRAGFGHRFHPSDPHEDEPHVDRRAIPANAERDVSRRLLQSNRSRAQPRIIRALVETAVVTRPARAGLGGDLRAGLGPRPPRRWPIPDDAALASLPEPRGPNQNAHPTPAEVSRTRGLSDERRSQSPSKGLPESRPRALCWHTHGRESVTQARSTRAPPVAGQLRHRVESPIPPIAHTACSAGARSKHPTTQTSFTRSSRASHDALRIRGPRTARLRAPPATSCPLFTGGVGEPNDDLRELACASRAGRPARLESRAARAARPSGAKGPPPPPLREERPRSATPEVPSVERSPARPY